MTTNTTNSQAASFDQEEFDKMVKEGTKIWAGVDISRDASQAASIDTPEFQALMNKMMGRLRTADLTGYNLDIKAWGDSMREVVAHIDAKRAQAREEGERKAYKTYDAAMQLGSEWLEKWQARAIAAESRLAEIQRGVEGLPTWTMRNIDGSYRDLVDLQQVLELIGKQDQGDTSGLPD